MLSLGDFVRSIQELL